MKKIISIALSALMVAALSTTAFAADIKQDASLPASQGTAVSYKVAPTYTVTIPESVTLTEQTDKSYAGSGDITTSAVRLEMGKIINVTISSQSDFTMKTDEGAKQKYQVTKDGKNTPLATGNSIAHFVTSETAQSVTLNYSSPNPKYAGEYKDTVTFTISITDNIA